MSVDAQELARRLEFGLAAAGEAGSLILKHYQHPELEVEQKGDLSPVTIADRGAEELLRERIAATFPGDGVLGEEFPEKAGSNGFRWILDPIDGTKSFIHGVPLFGTLIGVEYEGRPRLGICRFPALHEVVYAAAGLGAWWQIGDEPRRRARVSQIASLAEATFCTTNMTRWEKLGKQEAFQMLLRGTALSRGWGDCYGHMLVATGRSEVMVDPELSIWDAAALLPILQEAGGHFVDWSGQATITGGNGVSVNASLRDEVLRILQI